MSEKFKNLVYSMIDDIKDLHISYSNEIDLDKKNILEEEYISKCQEVTNMIVGKLNMIWKDIESQPDDDEKILSMERYNMLVEEFKNILEE